MSTQQLRTVQRFLPIMINVICAQWARYNKLSPAPPRAPDVIMSNGHQVILATPTYLFSDDRNLLSLRDKQAYLQSLDQKET